MTKANHFQQSINQFRAEDEGNFIFACQASVPLLLTPDLLYQLWNNFKSYQYKFDTETTYKISHLAVSDLLLSPLCREVGFGLYEMEKETRENLLLQLDENLGEKRKNTIALFLKDYALLEYRFIRRRNLKDIHTLTAQSFLDPTAMEKQIIELINKAEDDRDKINYLLLHRNLMPIGYDSDLGKISKEIAEASEKRELSPVLIAAENADAPGVFNINVELPHQLKGKIFKVRAEETAASREIIKAQKLIYDCLKTGSDFLNLSNCHLQDTDWVSGGMLDILLSQCHHQLVNFILTGEHRLTKIPPAIFNLIKLEKLHFGGNASHRMAVHDLPAYIFNLTSLQFLNLSYNSLTDIPAGITALSNLVLLNLEGNDLTGLRNDIGELSNLKELNLSKNQITILPDSLRKLSKLKELNLDDNPVIAKVSEKLEGKTPREILDLIFPPYLSGGGSSSRIAGIYSIGGTVMETDSFDAFTEIPSNRTLIAIKLTATPATRAEVVTNLLKLTDVFDHYNPTIQLNLMDANSRDIYDNIKLTNLQDFSINGLVKISSFLKKQHSTLGQYSRILNQLRTNKLLSRVFSNIESRWGMGTAVNAMYQILRPISSDDNHTEKDLEPEDRAIMASSELSLENAINSLEKLGGYDIIESAIEGSQNLNPARKARKRIFMEEKARAGERQELRDSLGHWRDVFEVWETIEDAAEHFNRMKNDLEFRLKANLIRAVEQVKELEISYRALALFYSNAETSKVKNVSIVNADLQQLKDLDNDYMFQEISSEIISNFDRMDLRNNYSVLVVPGYLGAASVVHRWAKMAHKNKVILITDFEDMQAPDEMMEAFNEANLASGEIFMSNAVMTCNWLIGRDKYQELNEIDALFIPPSPALAGRIYNSLISQVTAGKKFGTLSDIEDVRFSLRKSEIANIEKIGLVPMVKEYGKVMPFSAKTLFNGDNLALQTYPVVKAFDQISKTMIDLLNRQGFENFNLKTHSVLRNQMVKYLDSITGPSKAFQKSNIIRFEKDPNHKDHIYLHVLVIPYFPAKSFLIKLDGQMGDEGFGWKTEYEQTRS